jgi:hypothetical protein
MAHLYKSGRRTDCTFRGIFYTKDESNQGHECSQDSYTQIRYLLTDILQWF